MAFPKTEVAGSIGIDASLAEVWDYYFDARGWPDWVDQFGGVMEREGYPAPSGTLAWNSTAAGRGEVSERVLEHAPRSLHRIAFTDPQTEGELSTAFEIDGEQTRVEQRLLYRLRKGGIFAWATNLLFIRSQQRRSIQRSLLRLKREVEARSDPPGPAPGAPAL